MSTVRHSEISGVVAATHEPKRPKGWPPRWMRQRRDEVLFRRSTIRFLSLALAVSLAGNTVSLGYLWLNPPEDRTTAFIVRDTDFGTHEVVELKAAWTWTRGQIVAAVRDYTRNLRRRTLDGPADDELFSAAAGQTGEAVRGQLIALRKAETADWPAGWVREVSGPGEMRVFERRNNSALPEGSLQAWGVLWEELERDEFGRPRKWRRMQGEYAIRLVPPTGADVRAGVNPTGIWFPDVIINTLEERDLTNADS